MRKIVYAIILAVVIGLAVLVIANKQRKSERKQGRTGTIGMPESQIAKSLPASKVERVKGEIDIRNAFVEVAESVGKAVVTVSTERTQKVGFPGQQFQFKRFGRSPFGGEDPFEKFFEDFFGQFPEREFKQKGLGSGFIIDKEGHILTNYHVVEGADKINVTLPDGRNFAGMVQGFDSRSDLAVIKINAKDLPVAELGNSDMIQVGEWVLALGNPFGHVLQSPKPTVTVGVVSALHRRIPAPGGETGYLDMIQTDAAINPGNSGGPLCDLNGKVIGINVAIFSTSGGYQGVGFAIPANSAKLIVGDLIQGKEIAYGWLGVSVQEITPEMAEYFNLSDQKGALISEVLPDSPAEKADLKEGDIIISYNGKEIEVVYDLLREVGNTKIGKIVPLEIIRDRVRKTTKVEITKRPSQIALSGGEELKSPGKIEKWRGINVAEITDEIAHELNLKDKSGVVILDIDQASPGAMAGLRKGDVIKEINKTTIRNLADYAKITSESSGIALVRTYRGYFTLKEDEKK